jgi:hypothetical protein
MKNSPKKRKKKKKKKRARKKRSHGRFKALRAAACWNFTLPLHRFETTK